MKKAVCLFIILIATFSCKNEVVEKPKGLIAKEKMIDINYKTINNNDRDIQDVIKEILSN